MEIDDYPQGLTPKKYIYIYMCVCVHNSRKEGGREHAKIENSVDASIQVLKENTKR